MILSQNLGANKICIAILTILYVLQFDIEILLRFQTYCSPYIYIYICCRGTRESHEKTAMRRQVLFSHRNKSAEKMLLAPYLKRRLRTSYEGK